MLTRDTCVENVPLYDVEQEEFPLLRSLLCNYSLACREIHMKKLVSAIPAGLKCETRNSSFTCNTDRYGL